MLNQNKKENRNDEDLTIDKVKKFKGFENISDDEAQNIAASLKEFSLIAFEIFLNQTNKIIHQN